VWVGYRLHQSANETMDCLNCDGTDGIAALRPLAEFLCSLAPLLSGIRLWRRLHVVGSDWHHRWRPWKATVLKP